MPLGDSRAQQDIDAAKKKVESVQQANSRRRGSIFKGFRRGSAPNVDAEIAAMKALIDAELAAAPVKQSEQKSESRSGKEMRGQMQADSPEEEKNNPGKTGGPSKAEQ